MDIEKFKVLTLNCWGVFAPVVCVKRHERLTAIGEKLCEGYYDIILLQEIWTESDYKKMKQKLQGVYGYDNYFHSNLIGSGCCIFTKFKILSTFFYRFSMNGYPHNIHHGDWFGGKGIGMATLEVTSKKFRINVYVTHIHARYEHQEINDQYYFHRIVQGYEMGDFIRLTSSSCDAVIVGGDFNMDDSMLGFKFIIANAGLKDAWFHKNNQSPFSVKDAATCDRPDSPYCNKKWNQFYPDGERLDYIFYKQNSCIKLVCTSCSLQMRAVPECEAMHYSDHSGVEAHFEISQNPLEVADEINHEKLIDLSAEAMKKVSGELKRIKRNCRINFMFFIVTFLCVLFDYPNSFLMYLMGEHGIPVFINRLWLCALSISCFIFFWYFVVIRSNERKAVLNFRQNINLILQNTSVTKRIAKDDDARETVNLFKDKTL